ncbi:MAG: hypothetical protein IPJ87_01470 [Flavobacteriales bacterium]|nr:hypothetical protein [Flavobacteriales bacterium]
MVHSYDATDDMTVMGDLRNHLGPLETGRGAKSVMAVVVSIGRIAKPDRIHS